MSQCIVHYFCPENRRCKTCGMLYKDYQAGIASYTQETAPVDGTSGKDFSRKESSSDQYIQQCSGLTSRQ